MYRSRDRTGRPKKKSTAETVAFNDGVWVKGEGGSMTNGWQRSG